ncbi:MAG: hypothetical protein RBT59_13585 [Arcobacteraceae bacterium]|jgi:hypothetical protein|nr:hypothetical protein [Arcobacteraceae bacterium]
MPINKERKEPIAIKLNSTFDIEEVNKLYDNQFDFLRQDLLPCYVTIEGFNNSDYSWFGANTSNKDEILKDFTLVSIERAKEIHIPTPSNIKIENEIENQKIDNLFASLKQ